MTWRGWIPGLAVDALLSVVLLCIVAAGLARLPFPIALGLDPSYRTFFAIADARNLSSGVDYIFTYGPLASWYLPVEFDRRLLYGMILRGATAFVVAAALWRRAGGRRGACLAVGVLYLMFADLNAPLLIALLALAFAFLDRAWITAAALLALITVWGLTKFTGAVGLYLSLAYVVPISIVVLRWSLKKVAALLSIALLMHSGILAAIYGWYLDQPLWNYAEYMKSSFEISQGYAQFMGVGSRSWSLIGYLGAIALVAGWHARALPASDAEPGAPSAAGRRMRGMRWQSLALASCTAPALFIAMKQGYIRQDGHEVAGYIAAFAYASMVACASAPRVRLVVPLQMALAVAVAWGVHATKSQSPWGGVEVLAGRVTNAFDAAVDVLSLLGPGARQAAAHRIAERNAAVVADLRGRMPLITGLDSYDIFAPEQTLAALNPHGYSPRPVFQGYSAYTAALQDLNGRHVERVPQRFLVDFSILDGRYPNLDDGSALAQIAMQFCPEAWHGSHVLARRSGPHLGLATLEGLRWHNDSLLDPEPVELPAGVVLGRLDVRLTALGRLAAAVYRLPPLIVRVELSDGRSPHVRLIPSGRYYPVILSPWLESTADLTRIWSGAPGTRVTRISLVSAPAIRLLVAGLDVAHASLDPAHVAGKCAAETAIIGRHG